MTAQELHESLTLRAWGTAHLRKRFRAECCVYEKTVELNATSCSNTPAGPTPLSAAHGPGFVTNWLRRDPYTLPQLGEVIPLGWRKPTVAETAIGRNCSMFDALRRWAGKPENRENDVLAAAMSINEEIGRLHGKPAMDQSEVAAIARSVHRKRREWIAKG